MQSSFLCAEKERSDKLSFSLLSAEGALPPPLGEVARRSRVGGGVASTLGHSPSQKSEIFASPLREGAKASTLLLR